MGLDLNSQTIKRQNNNSDTSTFKTSLPKFTFDDLILSDATKEELRTVIYAHKCYDKVFNIWGLGEVIKQDSSLFVNLYGASGTGKTMAANAICHELKKNFISVNYADIESKYVGETTKNLHKLFETAHKDNVVIFFDEADALLSRRVTDMRASNDVSVNQTRSELLKILNDYDGIVIFATNFISNYDSAFMRRIQYHIKFELPNEELRRQLWKKYIPPKMPTDVDITYLAKTYDNITGSDIRTAVLKAAFTAATANEDMVSLRHFENAVISIVNSKKSNQANDDLQTKTRIISEKDVPQDILKIERQEQ